MKKKYQVGTKITIRSRADLREEFPFIAGQRKSKGCIQLPHIFFIPEMKPLCGQQGIIVVAHGLGNERYFEVAFENKRLDNGYLFTKEMFIP